MTAQQPAQQQKEALSTDQKSWNWKTWIFGGVAVVVVAAVIIGVSVAATRSENEEDTVESRIRRVLQEAPIIDGHNDLPWNLRALAYNDLRRVNLSSDLKQDPVWSKESSSHTDIPRLRAGHVGAQFWVAYTSCSSQYKDSVEQTFEQIDVIKRMAKQYSDDMQLAMSVADIEEAMSKGKIASLIAVEGGHSMQFSFAILRSLYELGARYMTLTHSCNTPWADASPVDGGELKPESDGLSDFGLKVVEEMNRLGIMVDLSHVSADVMRQALNHSVAPVIFSHSSARGVCNHHRNVPDDVLEMVKETNSLVMVNFYSGFVNCNNSRPATIDDVVEHIQYIRNITGPDHVGLGADYDGVDQQPIGLEDVSKYPDLLTKLAEKGWSTEDLMKLSNKNLLRVFREVEKVRNSLSDAEEQQETMKMEALQTHNVNLSCITAKFESSTNTKDSRVRRMIAEERDIMLSDEF